jgi:AraC-like DNA-binding protein
VRLVAQADILLEGFRLGVAERLGIGPDDCLKRHHAVDQIAFSIGYEDAGAFRSVFHKVMGISPSAYRKRVIVARRARLAPRRKVARSR